MDMWHWNMLIVIVGRAGAGRLVAAAYCCSQGPPEEKNDTDVGGWDGDQPND